MSGSPEKGGLVLRNRIIILFFLEGKGVSVTVDSQTTQLALTEISWLRGGVLSFRRYSKGFLIVTPPTLPPEARSSENKSLQPASWAAATIRESQKE